MLPVIIPIIHENVVGASHVPNIKGKLFIARNICKMETSPNIIPDIIKYISTDIVYLSPLSNYTLKVAIL
jgi:hypothetical protein|tara:strand:+ start:380 stop:589 length:210 start_codon:yes stop_codon:yes gene_type:complete